ncbi:MAG TPA: ATP-binding protein [Nitrospiraceae bacterium]|jgi:PAS domain S-box-containing protein|nr:ATP-binding protein [Nitrospiraceae bacterium]
MRYIARFLNDLPIARKLLLASLIPVLTIVILSVVTYRSVQVFSEDEEHLNTIYLTQKRAAEYIRLVVDMETGFRGYVMTQQTRYLHPYRTAQESILVVGQSLLENVSESEPQRKIIIDVQRLVKQLSKEKEELIEQVKSGHVDMAMQYVEAGRGRAIMVIIRDAMSQFDHLEQDALHERLAKIAQDRDAMLSVFFGGGALALVLMIVSLHLIGRSITSPLVALAKTVGSASTKPLADVPATERRDEIGNLIRVMHMMSVQLGQHLEQMEQSEAELRAVNQDLSASESKYRSLVDHAPFGIFTTQGMVVTFSNRYNRSLAGLNPDDAAEAPDAFRQWIHQEDRARVLTEFAEAVRENRPYETIFRFAHRDGTVRKVLSRRIPIQDEQGRTVMYQGFNIDISALDQMQTQLRRAERLATLGQFAAGIAHEIRNPLVGIGSTTALLLDDASPDDPRRADLEIIFREIHRLDRIVNQIVDYARPRSLALAWFSLSDVVHEGLKLLETVLEEKHLVVTCRLSSGLPPLQADRDQVKQVFLNVVQNAIEASQDKGTISILATELGRGNEAGIGIRVTDQGCGISADDLFHVFEPFFTLGKRRGTGLGLAICRNIIESHAGDISVTSELGKGTSVNIWLPLRQPQLG